MNFFVEITKNLIKGFGELIEEIGKFLITIFNFSNGKPLPIVAIGAFVLTVIFCIYL